MRAKRIAIVGSTALTTLAIVLVTAMQVASQTGAPPTRPVLRECTGAERRTVLRDEQAAVLRRLGPLRELRDAADIAALAKPPLNYVFLAHQYTSFRGIGLTVINFTDTVRPGVPSLVFYAPAEDARNTTDPRGPDFPYTLVGWGYGVPYEPGRIPALIPCMGTDDWHIHERGVHPIDTGGMTVMPPAETSYGAAVGSFADPPAMEPVVGFPHPRVWTVHFWLESGGVPSSAILDPHDPPPGIPPGLGSSFYFPERSAPPLPATQKSASRPFVLPPGSGERVKIRNSSYVFKVGDDESSGAFAVVEIVLRRGGEPPPHIHNREAEAFYILDGEMTFQIAGQTLTAETGSFVFLPRGVAHSYTVSGDGEARVLLIASPPGLERFFKRLSELGNQPPSIEDSLGFGIEPAGPPAGAP